MKIRVTINEYFKFQVLLRYTLNNYTTFCIFPAFTHLVQTAPRVTSSELLFDKVKRMVCTLGKTQCLTLLFALLTELATCGLFPHILQIRAIVSNPLKSSISKIYSLIIVLERLFFSN